MSSKIERAKRAATREFPDRILVADVAHPEKNGCEATIVSTESDWGDLPVTWYVREDRLASGETE